MTWYEPNPIGDSGVAKRDVVETVKEHLGDDPFQEGTAPKKTHTMQVRVTLRPDTSIEDVAEVVYALESMNLTVDPRTDGRFKSGHNPRTLCVQRKWDDDQESTWWEKIDVPREVYKDGWIAPTESVEQMCAESGCSDKATHEGPAESAAPNPPIVGWCDDHATAMDKKI